MNTINHNNINYTIKVNTESLTFSNQGILHLQGGWPKDVDPSDVEHTIRFRKKIEKDEEYIKSVKNLGDVRIKLLYSIFFFIENKNKININREEGGKNINFMNIVIGDLF